jgi:hypothetical protein
MPGAVPTDHYGPPACSAKDSKEKPSNFSGAVETAHREEMEGLRDAQALPSGEPVGNFGVARYRLLAYGECSGNSGCYWADLDAQYKRAEGALAVEVAHRRPGEKLAMVMDIDETTLTNYCEMKREDFGYITVLYNPWENGPDSVVAIPGALRLFHEARAAGVAVFFLSGRPGVQEPGSTHADHTASAERNLKTAGFHDWAGLLVRNGAENGMPTIAFKSAERKKIVAKGYRIVLSVGDQWSDLLGEPKAEVSIKLPDPFYFIP